MINSFKKIISYILLYTLKYTPMIGWVVGEAFNKTIGKDPWELGFVPDIFVTQKVCNEAAEADPYTLGYVPGQCKTNEMFYRLLEKYLCHINLIPDHLKTQEMCDKVVNDDPSSLQYVSDWFVTQQQLQIWHDDIGLLNGTKVIKNERLKKPQ